MKSNKKGSLTKRDIKQLEIVDKNGMRLDTLINDLLDLSRIQVGKIKLSTEEIEVSNLVDATVDGFLTILADKQQTISLKTEHEAIWLDIDSSRVAQVITNLVNNASKYSPGGSEITVSSALDGNDWVLSVTDTGPGIASEHQGQLFTLFYRTPDAYESATPGTGIGLYLSKQIVELHGGTVQLHSTVGKGTTVTFRVPGVRTGPSGETADIHTFSNSFERLEEAG